MRRRNPARRVWRKLSVVISIDPEEAREMKAGGMDWDAYPNWDANYGDDPEDFIDSIIDELESYNQYSGIDVHVVKLVK